jgi:hypothetical protein
LQIYVDRGETIPQAMVQSNLALAYQKQGQWQQAETAIANSLQLLNYDENITIDTTLKSIDRLAPATTAQLKATLAQALNTKASLQFARGKTRKP